jgi:sugar O-acyltransferase (sialic acid O-acetyltransferase NeuD family)
MHDLIIVGAGGFGHELHAWLWDAFAPEEYRFKGFLGRREDCAAGDTVVKWLADPEAYQPQTNDRFLLAIGDVAARRRIAETLQSRRAQFVTFRHPSAIIAATARIGIGAVIYPLAVVSHQAVLGDFVHLSLYASAGHDSHVGENCYLAPYATINGQARVGRDSFLGTHTSVGPGVHVGERSKICSGSCALRNVPPDSFVVGVPGRIVSRVEFEREL